MKNGKLPIVSEIKIIYRNKVKKQNRNKIQKSEDVYLNIKHVFSELVEYRESFVIVLLNRANEILGYSKISEGGTNGTVVDLKIIFQVALKANASSIILCHNHPSGNLNPSNSDIEMTKKISQAGEIMDIKVLDHIIISSESYYSFADNQII